MAVLTRWRTTLLITILFSAATLAAVVFSRATLPRSTQINRPSSLPDDPALAAVDLGRRLFYERRLSGNGRLSCAGCHQQARGFGDGRTLSSGITGEPLKRNTPGLFNTAALAGFGWADPSSNDLARQVSRPLFAAHPPEMGAGGHETAILAQLGAVADYPPRFAAAFPADPDPITWPHIIEALTAFTRSLQARNSPYDRFVYQGDTEALTPAARRGMALFFSPGPACGHCHVDLAPPERATAPRWADLAYLANGAGLNADRGLAETSGDPADAYRFRVPPLRNVAVTAPYMHDGSLPTLEAVLRFYESGGQLGAATEAERVAARHPLVAGFLLSDSERRDLIAFLESLTDQQALTDTRFADPFVRPDQATPADRQLTLPFQLTAGGQPRP